MSLLNILFIGEWKDIGLHGPESLWYS